MLCARFECNFYSELYRKMYSTKHITQAAREIANESCYKIKKEKLLAKFTQPPDDAMKF